jgi:hypothetical protein
MPRLNGPIADVACGSGRNLIPFTEATQRFDCYDIRAGCIDPYIVQSCGSLLRRFETNLTDKKFKLPRAEYSLVLLVHFYDIAVLNKIVQAVKSGGFFILETIDDRRSNYLQLPLAGEVLSAIASKFKVLRCTAKLAGPLLKQQTIKLVAERR